MYQFIYGILFLASNLLWMVWAWPLGGGPSDHRWIDQDIQPVTYSVSHMKKYIFLTIMIMHAINI